jgi:hypothetical protein
MELRRREFTPLMLGGAPVLSLAGQAESDPLRGAKLNRVIMH